MLTDTFLLVGAISALFPLIIGGMILAAVTPFFLLGLAGKLWWHWQLRQMAREAPPKPVRLPAAQNLEQQLWKLEHQSQAEYIESAQDNRLRA